MEIKLYGEPTEAEKAFKGNYTKVSRVVCFHHGLISFTRNNGEQIVSTLRYKLIIKPTESIKFYHGEGFLQLDSEEKAKPKEAA